MFLVCFGSQYNGCSPWSVIVFDDAICFQFGHKVVNDPGLMGSISRRSDADRRDFSCIYVELDASDIVAYSFFNEHIPIVNDELLYF